MKKFLLVLLILAVIGGTAFAFDIMSYPPRLSGGNAVMIDAGIGLNSYSLWGSIWGYGTMSVIPLFLQAEYALPNIPLSVGLFGAYYQTKWEWSYLYNYQYNFLTIGTRANWHWGFDASLIDFYTGIWLGYRAFWDSWDGPDYLRNSYSYGGFDFGAQVGVHFYFTNVFGAMIETGYPYLLKAGVALKFGGGNGNTSSSSRARYIVNADSLNVRSGPSADDAIVGQLTRNARVEIIDRSGQWWKIRYGSIEGYVNSSFLTEEK